MANFEYYNSASRRKFLAKRNFGEIFTMVSIVLFFLVVMAIILMFQNSLFLGGLGQIVIGLSLVIESYFLAKRFASIKSMSSNPADYLSDDSIELLEAITTEAAKNNLNEISAGYVFEKATLTIPGKMIFMRLGLPFTQVQNLPIKNIKPTFSADLVELIEKLAINSESIAAEDLLLQIVVSNTKIQEYLTDVKTSLADFKTVANWIKKIRHEEKPKFWQKTNLTAGIGEDWSYGYTPVLSNYSTDLSVYFQGNSNDINIYSHAGKLNDIENILARPNKNNLLLVGEPGVGKKTIINALAAKLAHGDCLEPLKYKRIRQVDVGRLVAGGNRGELAARINNAFVEAVNAGNIILYIDNFQSLLGGSNSGEEVGGVDASQILLPFLEKSNLRIIASTTPNDYFARVRNNQAVSEVFEKIDIEPANAADTLGIMLESTDSLEYRYHCFFPVQTLRTTIELSERYIHDIPFPEKALRLMEEAAVNAGNQSKLKIIFPETIETLVSQKTNVPVGNAGASEKEKLLNLENLLHKRVIGQVEAISAVSDALRRVRAGLSSGKRPIGVFLFLGPTGVGKTETAKALAESYFNSEKNMIRLDMSEYQQPNSIGRLIGDEANPNGQLTDAILANPFSLILLDEIEKADKNVLNVFLQVFEDGRLTDARGRVSDFTNAIIIATSNAGSEFIRENIAKIPVDQVKNNLLNLLQQQGTFTPEFLNRFDGVIVYRPLQVAELQQVATLMIGEINKTLAPKKIAVALAPDALAKLVELGNDPQFGARPMRRIIQEKVENLLAKKMLGGEVAEGQTLNITLDDLG